VILGDVTETGSLEQSTGKKITLSEFFSVNQNR